MPTGRKDDTDLELPSLRLIRFLKTLETSLGHCFGRLGLSRVRLCSDVAAWAGGWRARDFCSSACLQSRPWSLSSRTLSVCRRTPLAAHRQTGRKVGHQNFSRARARSAATCRGSSRTRARRARKFFNLDRDKEMFERAVVSVPTTSRRFSENLSP